MKTITVLETIDELLNAAQPARSADDNSPYLPKDAVLVIDLTAGELSLTGDGSERFEIQGDLRQQPVRFLQAALKRLGLDNVRVDYNQ